MRSRFERVDSSKLLFVCVRERERERERERGGGGGCRDKRRRGGKEGERKRWQDQGIRRIVIVEI